MKKLIRGINTLIILVAAGATMYGQINLSGKKIHELPSLPSNVVDTNYLFIIANPIDGKPYKFKKNALLSGATGVVDGNYGDISVSGVSWSINASSVQNSKLATMGNNTFKGNVSGSTAVPQDLSVGQMQSALGVNNKLNASDTAYLSDRINSKMTYADTASLSNRINNKQDADADLTSLSSASGTNTIYYRSAANTWSPVTIGGNMTFSSGTLNSTAGGGGTWGSITGTIGNQTDLAYELSQKQAQLVSSSNIKTINNISILGSGNLSISTDTTYLSNRINTKLNSIDTASLSNRINTKQNTISVTTEGVSGGATISGSVLNIPQYDLGFPKDTITDTIIDAFTNQYIWQLDHSADVTLSSTNLTRWNEKGGSGKDFIIASGYPTYYSSASNGKPYVTGNNLTLSSFPIDSTPATMYFLIRTPTIIDETAIIYWAGNNGANGPRYGNSTFGKRAYIYTGLDPYYSYDYYNVARTDWMLMIIRFSDKNTLSIEINDEPMSYHRDDAGGTKYPFSFLNLSNYSGLQVSEMRIFSRLTTPSEDIQIKKYFIDKYNIQYNQRSGMIVFGDSHSAGVMSGTGGTDQPYPKLLGDSSNIDVIFNAKTGATVESVIQGSVVYPDYKKYNIPKYKDYWLHFQLGTNDAATSNINYGFQDWLRWKDDYKSYILSFIKAGFNRDKIIIATPPYSTGSYVTGQLDEARDKILEIASELRIKLADWYKYTLDAGIDANAISGDAVHVNNPAHNLIFRRMDYLIRNREDMYFESPIDPTTTILNSKEHGLFKNTNSGVIKQWVNDNGTLKSVTIN